jgi:hypothetical protein
MIIWADLISMNLIFVATSLLAGWAVLRVIGGERQRQIQDMQVQSANDAAAVAAAAKPAAAGGKNSTAR